MGDFFRRPVFEDDVVWAWAGVRVVPDGAGRRARDRARGYLIDVEATGRQPPLVSVLGGRLTTCRRLAEEALDQLRSYLPMGQKWTAGAGLPGGLFPVDGLGDLTRALRAGYPFLTARHAARLAAAYGTRAHTIVSGARSLGDLGRGFGADLTESEVRYLMEEEWAETADDILWRRSKLGLRLTPDEAAGLGAWLANARGTDVEREAPPLPRAGAA